MVESDAGTTPALSRGTQPRIVVCTVSPINIGDTLFAEAVTFDTGDVIAILAILTLIGLAFIAGLAGFAYLIVTVTRGAKAGLPPTEMETNPPSHPPAVTHGWHRSRSVRRGRGRGRRRRGDRRFLRSGYPPRRIRGRRSDRVRAHRPHIPEHPPMTAATATVLMIVVVVAGVTGGWSSTLRVTRAGGVGAAVRLRPLRWPGSADSSTASRLQRPCSPGVRDHPGWSRQADRSRVGPTARRGRLRRRLRPVGRCRVRPSRFCHTTRFGWATHAPHHTGTRFNPAWRCVSRGRHQAGRAHGRHGLVRSAVADRRRSVRGLQRPPGVPASRPLPPTPPARRRRVHDPGLTPGPP